MGRLLTLISVVMIFLGSVFGMAVDKADDVKFTVDTRNTGAVINNKHSNINLWSLSGISENTAVNPEADMSFVEYVQLMTATGGNEERDPFIDPLDRSTLTDYDFSRIFSSCRGILNIGAKPLIKTGNVPLKFSSNPIIGGFGVNVCPPDSYDDYYKYICDFAAALVEEFGRDEVLTWRFGVLTEFENADWFYAGDKDPQKSFEEYCKLYDCTVEALTDTVGEDICVGAHSMAVTEGLWDERLFIEHCAVGTNFMTGEKGTKIDYISASFYDTKPGVYTAGMQADETIKHLRDAAERVGLNDLFYGFDEGRILEGNTSGSIGSQLVTRTCGYTYQAAYDARHLKQMADNDIDYFSSWGYTTGSAFTGFPTVANHIATEFYQMAGSSSVKVGRKASLLMSTQPDAVAAFDSQSNTLRIMAYNFKNDLDCNKKADMVFDIKVPELAGKRVKIRTALIDDSANFFDEWVEDRKTYGITDDCFGWSPDDPSIDTATTLNEPWARELYFTKLRDGYKKCAELIPTYSYTTVSPDGVLKLEKTLECNTVVFFTVEAK